MQVAEVGREDISHKYDANFFQQLLNKNNFVYMKFSKKYTENSLFICKMDKSTKPLSLHRFPMEDQN